MYDKPSGHKKTGSTTAQEKLIYRCFLPDLTGFEKLSLHRSRTEREGFEPSVPFRAHTTSNRVPSTTRTSLPTRDHLFKFHCVYQPLLNGERGIRTPGTLRYNGFRDRPIRPLSHLSSSMRLGGLEPSTFRSAI